MSKARIPSVELKLSAAGSSSQCRHGVKGQNSERGIETDVIAAFYVDPVPVSKARIPSVELKPASRAQWRLCSISVKGQNSERGIETVQLRPSNLVPCPVSKARIPSVELKLLTLRPLPPERKKCQRPEFRAWN